LDVEINEPRQLAGKELHMDAGPAIDVGRPLSGQQADAHDATG
jgi:hypothetical protein